MWFGCPGRGLGTKVLGCLGSLSGAMWCAPPPSPLSPFPTAPCAGDSRAILVRSSGVVALSWDHKPFNVRLSDSLPPPPPLPPHSTRPKPASRAGLRARVWTLVRVRVHVVPQAAAGLPFMVRSRRPWGSPLTASRLWLHVRLPVSIAGGGAEAHRVGVRHGAGQACERRPGRVPRLR